MKKLRICALLLLVVSVWGYGGIPAAQAAPGKDTVLILAQTVSGGASSLEATAATELGLKVDVVDDAGWRALSRTDFASYRAVILGDPFCRTAAPQVLADTAETWSSAVTGNVIVIGTDPRYHAGQGGAALTRKGIAFATANTVFTGAYITLSCYFHGARAGTPVPMLRGFGDFTVTGVGCYNKAHIVADHPALAGLTDANLSNWGCSVHEAFDSWPDNFQVLAIAQDFGDYQAPDGTRGTPYIMARGVNCGEDGLDLLDGTPAQGAASAIVHDTAEPLVFSLSPDLASVVHSVNCETVVPLENAIDDAL